MNFPIVLWKFKRLSPPLAITIVGRTVGVVVLRHGAGHVELVSGHCGHAVLGHCDG